MAKASASCRVGVDIGGTFTDVALDVDGTITSTKILTDYAAPERAVLDGIRSVAEMAGIARRDIDLVIHGTTLATNALIERRGARTALVTTEGFRDVIEMRTENRFEQYDLNIVLPPPLIERADRFTLRERVDAQGKVLVEPTRPRSRHWSSGSPPAATRASPSASSMPMPTAHMSAWSARRC